MASTRQQALDAYGEFIKGFKAKYPKAATNRLEPFKMVLKREPELRARIKGRIVELEWA